MVEKSGSWFSFNGERIGQGREQSKEYLRAQPEIVTELEKRLFEKNGLKAPKEHRHGPGGPDAAAGGGQRRGEAAVARREGVVEE